MTINELLEQAIALAREQHGEREYEYRRFSHNWSSPRKRGARGRWYTDIGGTVISKEEYEANLEQGKTDSSLAFRGKLTKSHYYDYRREKAKDGWQDALITIIEDARDERETREDSLR